MKLVVRHGLRCFNKLGYTNDLKHETINFSDTVPFVSELLDKLRIKLILRYLLERYRRSVAVRYRIEFKKP
jgi:hypothetical protein